MVEGLVGFSDIFLDCSIWKLIIVCVIGDPAFLHPLFNYQAANVLSVNPFSEAFPIENVVDHSQYLGTPGHCACLYLSTLFPCMSFVFRRGTVNDFIFLLLFLR